MERRWLSRTRTAPTRYRLRGNNSVSSFRKALGLTSMPFAKSCLGRNRDGIPILKRMRNQRWLKPAIFIAQSSESISVPFTGLIPYSSLVQDRVSTRFRVVRAGEWNFRKALGLRPLGWGSRSLFLSQKRLFSSSSRAAETS